MKKALVTGVTGQDGAFLSEILLKEGYHVIGGARYPDKENHRLKYLNIQNEIELVPFQLTDKENIFSTIKFHKPDEIYNLAAQSSVGKSFSEPLETALVDGIAVAYILDAIRIHSPNSKFFQAGSTEMYGNCEFSPQNESSSFKPINPYSSAKVYAYHLTSNYRKVYNLFTVNGILFNHESELRGIEFFTRRVTSHVARISKGEKSVLDVGNIDAERDIGYAKEFAEAIHLTLKHPTAEDFIISTGKKTTIRQFIEFAFDTIGITLEWTGTGYNEKAYNNKNGDLLIKVNQANFRPADIDSQCGNPSKIKNVLGWEAKTDVREIAHKMVTHDILLLQ